MKVLKFFILVVLIFFSASVFANNEGIVIRHDNNGIPHVYAKDAPGVFFGYGYCLAKDRLFQLEVLRRSVEGTLAEVFGEKMVDNDFAARRDKVFYKELREELEACSDDFKLALTSFTNGINRVVSDVLGNKCQEDPAFAKAQIKPRAFTELQILNIFAGTMAARYNDFTVELENLQMLRMLTKKYGARTASEIFEDIVVYEDPNVYTTLGNINYDSPGHRFKNTEHFLPQEGALTTNLPGIESKNRNAVLKTLGIPDKSGSYAAVFSVKEGEKKKAILFGGPQMGYFSPSAVYCIGLHTPDFDIVGSTPVGYFFVMFAANRDVAFTATAGVGNLVDLIALKQDKNDKNYLVGLYDSKLRVKKTIREEKIIVKDKKTTVCKIMTDTELGPVVAVEGDTFYVKNRAWRGQVVKSYEGWFESNFAKSLDELLKVSDKNALSINWLGADKKGNIAFVHCGKGKNRRSFGEDRLPTYAPNDYSLNKKRLAAVNPETGFFVNWNCPPADGFRDGDMQNGWVADQRTKFLADHIERNRNEWSIDYLIELERDIAFTDQRAYFFKDLLLSCVKTEDLNSKEKNGFDMLANWDGMRNDDDEDGFFDNAGAGFFDKFFNDVFNELFLDKLGEFVWIPASDSTWTQSAVMARALKGLTNYDYLSGRSAQELVTSVFKRSFSACAEENGEIRPVKTAPMEFGGLNHIGAPTLASTKSFGTFMNRGTDVQLTELSEDGIKVLGCMAPGNAATGVYSENQIADFKAFNFMIRPLLMNEVKELSFDSEIVFP
jgi:penicillin amidase